MIPKTMIGPIHQAAAQPVPPASQSFWIASTPETDYPYLTADVEVDVAVVGAGITGITTAVTIKNKLNRSWELTPLILFMKELLVGAEVMM